MTILRLLSVVLFISKTKEASGAICESSQEVAATSKQENATLERSFKWELVTVEPDYKEAKTITSL